MSYVAQKLPYNSNERLDLQKCIVVPTDKVNRIINRGKQLNCMIKDVGGSSPFRRSVR